MSRPMERIVLRLQSWSGLGFMCEKELRAEVAEYDSATSVGAHKTKLATEWFDQYAVEAPSGILQRIDWARGLLAAAEGDLLKFIIESGQSSQQTQTIVAGLESARQNALLTKERREMAGEGQTGGG